jgi:DNA-binding transcriptional regulator YbjK
MSPEIGQVHKSAVAIGRCRTLVPALQVTRLLSELQNTETIELLCALYTAHSSKPVMEEVRPCRQSAQQLSAEPNNPT